jgi:sorbitol-specific phosphotransferase system component IIC
LTNVGRDRVKRIYFANKKNKIQSYIIVPLEGS